MMTSSMYICANATLTISPIKDIDIVHVSWGFYSSDNDNFIAACALSILHGRSIMESLFFV